MQGSSFSFLPKNKNNCSHFTQNVPIALFANKLNSLFFQKKLKIDLKNTDIKSVISFKYIIQGTSYEKYSQQ